MLGKLIKHEFRASRRMMLPFILASLLLSLLFGITIRFMDNGEVDGILAVLMGLISVAFVMGLIALFAMSYVVMVERFRKNLLGDEGYLMFTLPVSVDMHILSKMLVSLMWFLLAGLTFALCMVLMMLVNVQVIDVIDMVDWDLAFQRLGEVMKLVMDELGLVNILGYILELILLFLAGGACMCLMFYLSMAIGYSFSDRKLLMSVLAFFALSFILNIVSVLGLDAMISFALPIDWVPSDTAAVHLGLLAVLAPCLIQAAVLYIPTRILLQRKLNLP